jgi:hypothetical protein
MPPKAMPKSLGKRTRESREPADLEVNKRPTKLPKNKSSDSSKQIRDTTFEEALADIATCLQDKETRGLLSNSRQLQPKLASEIFAFQITLQKAIDDANNANPIDFDGVTKGMLYQLILENYDLRDDAAEMRQGWVTRDKIIQVVKNRILAKVNSAAPFETKISALSAVATVINAIVGMENGGEFADALQDEELATAVTAELVKLGRMLSNSEIQRIAKDKELIAKLKAAKEFKISWKGMKPWAGLREVLALLKTKK